MEKPAATRDQTILAPLTPNNSSCGYCSPLGQRSKTKSSWHAAECQPLRMSCQVYQKMIDRGWRRSGTYCYKPDLKKSCCAQYTIKLDARQFKPSRSQRKLVHRWNRFVTEGNGGDDSPSAPKQKRGRGEQSGEASFSLVEEVHAAELELCAQAEPKHRFEVALEPSSFTEEKFALYRSYQRDIHREDDEKPSNFERFLIASPLRQETIPYPSPAPPHLPREYGSYHQLYRLDGELIAMGVIDVLPNCVSSVYFMYKKNWEKYSLGKLSALREASLAREMNEAGLTDMGYLYMGFYIHTCPKMRYKGDYSPSYLADPEEYTWHPLEECRPLLGKYRYVSFAHPEHNLEGPPRTSEDDPVLDPDVPVALLSEAYIIKADQPRVALPITASQEWNLPRVRHAILTLLDGLGLELVGKVFLCAMYEL